MSKNSEHARLTEMNLERSLEAVAGYLELKMPYEALQELKMLDPEARNNPRYLDLLLAAEMMEKQWNAASETARKLCALEPDKSMYFIHAAYCLHETGDTLAAKHWLMRGPKELMQEPLYHYNMGCYAAVLGDLADARSHLDRAFSLDDSLREIAKNDKDLTGVFSVM